MATHLELAEGQCRAHGLSPGEDVPGPEAMDMETRVKSGERPRLDNTVIPVPGPRPHPTPPHPTPSHSLQHLQSLDPTNSLLGLKLLGVDFLSLTTRSSNTGRLVHRHPGAEEGVRAPGGK